MTNKINILRAKVARVKDAGMFDMREAAEGALDYATKLLEEYHDRIERLETLFKNVFPIGKDTDENDRD